MNIVESLARRRLLVVAYAFPPLHLPMAPCVAKTMAALTRLGYEIDVVCAGTFLPSISLDPSLLAYTEHNFARIVRLVPETREGIKEFAGLAHGRIVAKVKTLLADAAGDRLPKEWLGWISGQYSDPMSTLYSRVIEAIDGLGADQYEAIISWSPFHSVNRAVAEIKRRYPRVPWIAQFSDPWANNPLEKATDKRAAAERAEMRTVRLADYVVHTSSASLRLMADHVGGAMPPAEVIPIPFEPTLYPHGPHTASAKLIVRHVGQLFGGRSPQPLFLALLELQRRRPRLLELLRVELIGNIDAEMLASNAARKLPRGLVVTMPTVTYVESLSVMYDADILLLIEANVPLSLFQPSKLSDYIGAGPPIVGIVPAGAAHDLISELGGWVAPPDSPVQIADALEAAIVCAQSSDSNETWANPAAKAELSSDAIALKYDAVIRRVAKL